MMSRGAEDGLELLGGRCDCVVERFHERATTRSVPGAGWDYSSAARSSSGAGSVSTPNFRPKAVRESWRFFPGVLIPKRICFGAKIEIDYPTKGVDGDIDFLTRRKKELVGAPTYPSSADFR